MVFFVVSVVEGGKGVGARGCGMAAVTVGARSVHTWLRERGGGCERSVGEDSRGPGHEIAPVIDGGNPFRCQWARLQWDGRVPPGGG